MKDTLAAILAFLFDEDKKSHPMPTAKADSMLRKIQACLAGKKSNS